MQRILVVLFFCLSLSSCNEENNIDCSLVLCAANDSINLELIADGENVISNGTYTLENIVVAGNSSEELEIRVFPDTQGATTGLLEISSFDWQAGTYIYTISLDTDYEFNLEVTFSTTNDPCCGDRLVITGLSSDDVFTDAETYSSFYTIVLN
ncbi:hypothetical protein [Muriicola soli]|uniref:Uncharacterized protein n=1 Tax=Muriicola soli TaxID=2507538 RepID=A0A411EB42_9FLAO|nr:hypothetical protein [Muriicola soli]QBA64952.1 hypothetical protein EQY75_10685 [Muriicola soli]